MVKVCYMQTVKNFVVRGSDWRRALTDLSVKCSRVLCQELPWRCSSMGVGLGVLGSYPLD